MLLGFLLGLLFDLKIKVIYSFGMPELHVHTVQRTIVLIDSGMEAANQAQ
jgi:hypothetical protein